MTAFYSSLGLFLQIFLINILFASSFSKGQDLHNIRVTTHYNVVTLEQAFKILEKETGFTFTYKVDEIPLHRKVVLNFSNESFYDVLEKISGNYGLIFTRVNEQIVVKKSGENPKPRRVIQDTGTIRGTIKDALTREPLIGANIIIKSVRNDKVVKASISDINGNFNLESIVGEYTLEIRYVGYATIYQKVILGKNDVIELEFDLKESLVDLNEVTVTGSFSQREKKELANPVTIISMSTVRQMMPAVTNLTDILANNVPGYFQDVPNEFTFGSNLNPILRGSSSSSGKQLLIYIDGVPVSNESFKNSSPMTVLAFNGTPPGSQQQDINKLVNVNDIERIEVLRGPMATTLYGSGAGNGVINIITKKNAATRTRVNASLTFSSLSDIFSDVNPLKKNYVVGIAGGNGQIGYNLGVSRLERDYTYVPTAIPRYINMSYNGSTKMNLEPVMVDMRFDYMTTESGAQSVSKMWQRYQQVRGWSSFPLPSAANSKTDNNTFNASIIIKHVLSENWYHSLLVGYNSYNQTGYDYIAPSSTDKWNINATVMAKNSIRYFTNFNTHLLENLKVDLTTGFEYWKSTYDNTSISTSKPYDEQLAGQLINTTTGRKTFRKDVNQGYFAETVLGYQDKLFFTGGFRIEKNSNITANGGYAQAPRVGLSYVQNFDDLIIKPRISYGSSINPPRWEQVIGSVSTSVTILPNQELKAEKNAGYEIGADIYFADNYSLELTYYNQIGSDLIFIEIIPGQPGQPNQQQYRNVGKVKNQGLELVGSINLNPLLFRLTYSYMDNRYGSNYQGFVEGERVVNTPKNTLNANVSYTLPNILNLVDKLSFLSLSVQYRGSIYAKDLLVYYDGLYKPGAPQISSGLLPYIETGSYALLNFSANYWITNYLQAILDVRNLLDKQLVDGQFYPLIGREISIGLRADL